jgi:hypothetical protein
MLSSFPGGIFYRIFHILPLHPVLHLKQNT